MCLTSPEGSWFTRNGPKNFKNSSVGVSGANITRKISNTVRPNHDSHNNNNYHSRKNPNSPLPPRVDEEQDVGDETSMDDRVEQATALHDCK